MATALAISYASKMLFAYVYLKLNDNLGDIKLQGKNPEVIYSKEEKSNLYFREKKYLENKLKRNILFRSNMELRQRKKNLKKITKKK